MPRWIKILLGLLLTCVIFGALGYGFRDSIATRALAYTLDAEDNLSCSHPSVEVAASLAWADVAPIECKVRHNPMTEFKTTSSSRMFLEAFGVKRIHVGRAVFDFRERDVSHVQLDFDAKLANIVGMMDPTVQGLLDSAEGYTPNQPLIVIDRATMLRGGKRDSVMHDYTMSQDGVWNRSHASRVDSGSEGMVAMRDFDTRVTPRRAKLRMSMYFGDAAPGEKPDALIKVEASDLDQPKPRVDLSVDTDVDDRSARPR